MLKDLGTKRSNIDETVFDICIDCTKEFEVVAPQTVYIDHRYDGPPYRYKSYGGFEQKRCMLCQIKFRVDNLERK